MYGSKVEVYTDMLEMAVKIITEIIRQKAVDSDSKLRIAKELLKNDDELMGRPYAAPVYPPHDSHEDLEDPTQLELCYWNDDDSFNAIVAIQWRPSDKPTVRDALVPVELGVRFAQSWIPLSYDEAREIVEVGDLLTPITFESGHVCELYGIQSETEAQIVERALVELEA